MSQEGELKRLLILWCGLIAAQLGTGLWLFGLRYGWTEASVRAAHFGTPGRVGLGWSTWVEITGPHLFAIPTLSFALAHLLAFVAPRGDRTLVLALSLSLSAIAHTLSGGAVLALGPGWAWLKLGTLIWFQMSFALATWRILKASWLSQRKSLTAS